MTTAEGIAEALKADSEVHLIEESLPRILRCLDKLDEQEVWHRPNDACNSVGNLVLHLCGNVRQWIITGLGGAPDNRERDKEFDERGPIPKTKLTALLETTLSEARDVIRATDAESLMRVRPVQNSEVTGLKIVTHVVEHFSYHTGQIAYIVKMLKAVDLGYYDGEDLNKKGGSP